MEPALTWCARNTLRLRDRMIRWGLAWNAPCPSLGATIVQSVPSNRRGRPRSDHLEVRSSGRVPNLMPTTPSSVRLNPSSPKNGAAGRRRQALRRGKLGGEAYLWACGFGLNFESLQASQTSQARWSRNNLGLGGDVQHHRIRTIGVARKVRRLGAINKGGTWRAP